ncbi:MAG: OPT/YSL family transporter [Deltaproteobacteria bacterium]|nr:OPT/YSL family transporter [Deltaproteobacteria bacterium]
MSDAAAPSPSPAPCVSNEDASVPIPGHTLTVRSLVAGFVLSLVLCGVNSYLTLSFGVIEEGPTIAALFFFAFFFLSSVRITTTEMAIVATMGSAGGSLGFITNFFAAEAMAGEPYPFWTMVGFSVVTSLVGMTFVVPLRQMLILRENLPWPGSKAVESVIRALVEKGDPKQPWYLLVSTLACITIVVGNTDGGFRLWPDGSEIPLFGLAALGLGIAWSPFAIGGAYLMGFRVCVGFLAGAIVLLIMAPHTPTPAAPHRYVWPGIGFLVASGLVQMAMNWKVIVESFRSMVPKDGVEADDHDAVMTTRTLLVFGSVALLVTALFSFFALGLSPLVAVLLIVVAGFLQNVIATRAAAQTAFNPARVMGVLLQSITALSGASSAAQNLAGAGFVAGSGAQAGNLTGDMVYGRALRVPSRWQFWAQLTTIVPCALVSAWVFTQLQARQPMTLEGEGLPAPVAKMWAATALIFEGRTEMPPFAWQAMGLGALAGAIYVVFERFVDQWDERRNQDLIAKGTPPDPTRFSPTDLVPHSVGLGIGLVLPVSFDLAFFVGGVLLWIVLGRVLKVRDVTLTTIAVGSIVGEGLGGVLKPLLQMAGLITTAS